MADVRGAFSLTAGPGLDIDVAGLASSTVNASDRHINRMSRNDARSMREAAFAVALARRLTGHGATAARHEAGG